MKPLTTLFISLMILGCTHKLIKAHCGVIVLNQDGSYSHPCKE